MRSFLSDKMLNWVFAQIEGDLNCNFFEANEYNERELRAEIGRMNAIRKASEQAIEKLEGQKKNLTEEIEHLTTQVNNLKTRLNNEIEFGAAWQDKATETEKCLERAEATILRLKAKIYDLEHGAE
jgi:peptidoglycan hydrolase CwlO-like protein